MSRELGVPATGAGMHQAGADALLTSRLFARMGTRFFGLGNAVVESRVGASGSHGEDKGSDRRSHRDRTALEDVQSRVFGLGDSALDLAYALNKSEQTSRNKGSRRNAKVGKRERDRRRSRRKREW